MYKIKKIIDEHIKNEFKNSHSRFRNPRLILESLNDCLLKYFKENDINLFSSVDGLMRTGKYISIRKKTVDEFSLLSNSDIELRKRFNEKEDNSIKIFLISNEVLSFDFASVREDENSFFIFIKREYVENSDSRDGMSYKVNTENIFISNSKLQETWGKVIEEYSILKNNFTEQIALTRKKWQDDDSIGFRLIMNMTINPNNDHDEDSIDAKFNELLRSQR